MNRRLFLILAVITMLFSGTVSASAHQWRAKWVTKSEATNSANTWVGFRTKVDIDNVPSTLIARIAVDTKYWLWINGEIVVFEGGLKRGPKPGAGYYDEVEIAPYLKKGTNHIAVQVWHFGKNGFSHHNSGYAAMRFEAIGDGVEILSDKSWESSVLHAYQNTDAPLPNYRLPEGNIRFDARMDFEDWNKGGYPKRIGGAMEIWNVLADEMLGEHYARPIPLWKNYGLKEYVEVKRVEDTLFCKLPYNAQVTPYLKVKAPAGRTIHILTNQYAVDVDYNPLSQFFAPGVDCTKYRYMPHESTTVRAEYITKEGEQEYENLGWMNGEYVYYIVPKDVEVIDLKYRETGFDCEFTGDFHCDDPILNEFYKRTQRTLYICMRDTWYDCPDRERSLWIGDMVNELGEAYVALSPSAQQLTTKCYNEFFNWQTEDGSLTAPIPGTYMRELPNQSLAAVGWYGLYRHYLYGGNEELIANVYDRLHRYLHETWQLDEKGLPIHRPGGWDWGDTNTENLDRHCQGAFWFYLALKAEREFALLLGKDNDAKENEKIMERLKESLNKYWWDGTSYRSPSYKGGIDERNLALAVVSDIADESKYDIIYKHLMEIHNASSYIKKYSYEALIKMGHMNDAIEIMKRDLPTLMADGGTTIYEKWNFGGTNNHAWSGAPIILFVEEICGIKPTSIAYKTFSVTPDMGSLKHACAKVDTEFGLIEVSLERKAKTIKMNLTVPKGTTAQVAGKSYQAGNHEIVIK